MTKNGKSKTSSASTHKDITHTLTMETKPCSKCGKVKPLSEYYCYNGYYRTACKTCTIAYTNAMEKIHRYHVKTQARPEYAAYQRKYFLEHKSRYVEYSRTWRKRHPNYYRDYYRSKKTEEATRGNENGPGNTPDPTTKRHTDKEKSVNPLNQNTKSVYQTQEDI